MRKRKPKVVWLPNTEANGFGTTDTIYNAGQIVITGTGGGGALDSGDTGSVEFPVVTDGIQSDPLQPTSSLADIEDSGYRLRRIVGKIYCFHSVDINAPAFTFVTAGLIIRRVDPTTGGSLASVASAVQPFPLIAPGFTTNQMDPWIWRRTWLLGNRPPGLAADQNAVDPVTQRLVLDAAPCRNFADAYPGGIAEGPHVDQKTARVVGPEERLFLDVSATVFTQATNTTLGIGVAFELRVLASMRTSVGNRRNASR